jgi:hypothetical protein
VPVKKRIIHMVEMFWPKRDEVTGSGENYIMRSLNDLYSTPNIRMVKSRRMR